MTELVSGSASIADLYNRIGFYKSSPVRIAQATFNYLDDVLNNRVDLVDPTNPFILLLETSAIHTALAINESLLNMRRSYPGLAETDEDIYRHMTDAEFIGRFATPGNAPFTFMFDLNSLVSFMVEDVEENCLKAILPRDSYITIDTYTFTLEYPIVIRKFPNGVLQATYDVAISSPISKPSNNFIPTLVRQDNNGVSWFYFTIPVKQMKISTSNYAIQRESVFNKDIAFDDQFVFARVFQKSDVHPEWVEIYTTHSDQVFDRNTPTAVLKATTNNLNVTFPFIYNTLGLITGQVRIDIYTTKGSIDVNMGNYTLDKFTVKLRNLDAIRDDSVYTNVWSKINYFGFSDKILVGGTDGSTFEALRDKVINYAFGNFNIPVTTAQLDTVGQLNDFIIIRNADTLTGRYMLGIRSIPDISIKDTDTDAQKLLSRANIGMIRFSTQVADLRASDNTHENDKRITLLSNSAFLLENGKATLVESQVVSGIKAQQSSTIVSTVNAAEYVYTPYYYVYDLNDELVNVRPYDLDHPDAANLNFVRQNNTLNLVVNTGKYSVAKTGSGFRITITTLSGSSYKQLLDNQVAAQMRLTNKDNSAFVSINGVFQGLDPDSQERVYTFDLNTTYDVDTDHSIEIINGYGTDQVTPSFYLPLDTIVDILYTTTSLTTNYVADATDTIVNKLILPIGSVGNSHDTLELFLGKYLEHLWVRSRSYATGLEYLTSSADVPALYEKDEYEINPDTGSMLFFDGPGYVGPTGSSTYYGHGTPISSVGRVGDFYINEDTNDVYGPKTANGWGSVTTLTVVNNGEPNYHKTHGLGEPIYDSGQPVLKYRGPTSNTPGDNILDSEGNPIPDNASTLKSMNDFDILVIDGMLLFATDPNYVTYRDKVVSLMTGWITSDILEVQARLFERTEIFFYPQAVLGVTQILINGNQTVFIESQQTPKITVFLDSSVINDVGVRAAITATISKYMDANIGQQKFTVNQQESDLKTSLGNSVHGVTISGIGGDNDYKSISVTDQHNRLCIKRKLFVNTDNSITVLPALDIEFVEF